MYVQERRGKMAKYEHEAKVVFRSGWWKREYSIVNALHDTFKIST